MTEPSIGLHLSLRRDLSPKFTCRDNLSAPLSPKYAWVVVGAYDFLVVTPLTKLEDVERIPLEESVTPIGATAELVVFPFEKKSVEVLVASLATRHPVSVRQSPTVYSDSSQENTFVNLTEENPRFLCIATVILAPGFFQLMDSPSDLLNSMRGIADELVKQFQGESVPVSVMRALGSADLVIISFMDHEQDAQRFVEIFSRIRSLKMEDVLKEEVKASSTIAVSEAHAFASAELIFAYNDVKTATGVNDPLEPRNPAQMSSGSRTDRKIDFYVRLRTDCGHEAYVTSVLNELGHEAKLSTGAYPLSTVVSGFGQLRTLIDKYLLQPVWREANLIDSDTAVCITQKLSEYSNDHTLEKDNKTNRPVWKLSSDVVKVLEELRRAVTGLSEHLPDVLFNEAREQLRAIDSALRRQEFVSVVRDLLPFLRVLQDELKDIDFMGSETSTNDVIENITLTLSHLYRALRNRIDSRRLQPDPQLPTTVDRGLANLIPAYSAALSVAYDLLIPSGRIEKPESGNNDNLTLSCGRHFNACVAAGVAGYIQVTSIKLRSLGDKRDLGASPGAEKRLPPGGNTSTTELGDNGLWLADVSGLQLLRPSISFVFCFHEVAELTNWVDSQPQEIQEGFNSGLIQGMCNNIARFVKDDYEKKWKRSHGFFGVATKDFEEAKKKYENTMEDARDTEVLLTAKILLLRLIGVVNHMDGMSGKSGDANGGESSGTTGESLTSSGSKDYLEIGVEVMRKSTVTRFIGMVDRAMSLVGNDREFWMREARDFHKISIKGRDSQERSVVFSNLTKLVSFWLWESEVSEWLELFSEVMIEIAADTGMLAVVKELTTEGQLPADSDFPSSVDRIFMEILETVLSGRPATKETYEGRVKVALFRWVFQRAIIEELVDGDRFDDCLDAIAEKACTVTSLYVPSISKGDIRRILVQCIDSFSGFGGGDDVSRRLRRYYKGQCQFNLGALCKPLPPSDSSLKGPDRFINQVVSDFAVAWNERSPSVSVDFAFKLWAKSHFMLPREVLETNVGVGV